MALNLDLNTINNWQSSPPPPPHPDTEPPMAEVAMVDPFDLSPVRIALEGHIERIDAMSAQAQAVTVKDADSQAQAVEMAGQVKRLGKMIEAARVSFVAAPNEYVKSVNGLAKGILGKLDAIERGLKTKLGEYAYRLEMERRKAEEEARKALAEQQRKIDEEAKAANVEPVKLEAPVIPVKAEPVRTAAGTASNKTVWKFEVTDPQAVPREFLVVDESAIRKAVAAGVRTIAGVNIYETKEVAIRA